MAKLLSAWCALSYAPGRGGVRGGGTRTDGPAGDRFRMAYEFAEFARIIAEKDTAAEKTARARTLAVMDLLDTLRQNAE